MNKGLRKLEKGQNVCNKLPSNSVKGFFNVNFKGTSGGARISVIVPKEILSNQDVVTNGSTDNKGRLRNINDVGKDQLEPNSEDLRDALINSIAARDRSKVSH